MFWYCCWSLLLLECRQTAMRRTLKPPMHVPLGQSISLTLPSLFATASLLPSGLNAASLMPPQGTLMVCTGLLLLFLLERCDSSLPELSPVMAGVCQHSKAQQSTTCLSLTVK